MNDQTVWLTWVIFVVTYAGLALAMSSTFAGNLTMLGSMANLIVVENARREGVPISFSEYCKVGIPLTVLTLIFGIVWLQEELDVQPRAGPSSEFTLSADTSSLSEQ